MHDDNALVVEWYFNNGRVLQDVWPESKHDPPTVLREVQNLMLEPGEWLVFENPGCSLAICKAQIDAWSVQRWGQLKQNQRG